MLSTKIAMTRNRNTAASRLITTAVAAAARPPFSGSAKAPGASDGSGSTGDPAAYAQAYADFANNPVAKGYVQSKYRNAASLIKVTNSGRPAKFDSPISVTVEYRFKFNLPGIGKLLGEAGPDGGYYFPVESTVTLQNEGPRNSSQTLGIGYGSFN